MPAHPFTSRLLRATGWLAAGLAAAAAIFALTGHPTAPAQAAGGCDLSQFSDASQFNATVDAYATNNALQLVRLINRGREARGLHDLQLDQNLWLGAMWEAGNVIARNVINWNTIPCLSSAPMAPMVLVTTADDLALGDPLSRQLSHMLQENAGGADGQRDASALYSADYQSIGVGSALAAGSDLTNAIILGKGSAQLPPPQSISAQRDKASVTEDTLRHASFNNLTRIALANDSGFYSFASAKAKHGSVNSESGLGYHPNLNFHGIDTITYTIADFYGRTATAKIVVKVGDGKQTSTAKKIAHPKPRKP
jgi:hypothetical protein